MGTGIPEEAGILAGREGAVRVVRPGESHVRAMTAMFSGPPAVVLPGLCQPLVPPTLRDQAAAWMDEIYPGVPVTDEEGRPLLGGGLHGQVAAGAPVIAACLTATAGSTLVLMYPETLSRLDSQLGLGDLIAQTAAAGVHVVAATHADSIFATASDAVRLGSLPAGSVTIRHYRPGRGETIAGTAVIDADGLLTEQEGHVRDSLLLSYRRPALAP